MRKTAGQGDRVLFLLVILAFMDAALCFFYIYDSIIDK